MQSQTCSTREVSEEERYHIHGSKLSQNGAYLRIEEKRSVRDSNRACAYYPLSRIDPEYVCVQGMGCILLTFFISLRLVTSAHVYDLVCVAGETLHTVYGCHIRRYVNAYLCISIPRRNLYSLTETVLFVTSHWFTDDIVFVREIQSLSGILSSYHHHLISEGITR